MGLALTLLRFGFLALLWFFVFLVMRTVRADAEGTEIRSRTPHGESRWAQRRQERRARKEEQAAAKAALNSAPEIAPAPPVAPPMPAPAAPAQASRARAPRPTLVITHGPLAGTALPLGNQDIRIGRAPSNSLILDDSYASSHHARIFNENGLWWLEDLGSTNGTYVHEQPVTSPVRLQPGTSITIGQTVMEFQV